jgi:hypothetical protein
MLIRTRCGNCQTVAEVSKLNVGKVVICSNCGSEHVAQAEDEDDGGVIGLAAEEADVQAGAREVHAVGTVRKHSLALPPPPAEDCNLTGDEDGEALPPGQRFPVFRPRRKEIEPFLDREQAVGDNTILMVSGLVVFAVIGMAFFVPVILCILL